MAIASTHRSMLPWPPLSLPQLRLASLLLLADGIDRRSPESPPIIAVFPAVTQARRRQFCRHPSASGPVDLPYQLLVSPGSERTLFPPRVPAPERRLHVHLQEPTMAKLPGLCASVACLWVGLGPLQSVTKGQQTPGTKSPAAFFNFKK
jgi:hypothetical protein